jgi:hypothetical protein
MKFTLLHKSTFQVFDDDAAMQEDDDLMTGAAAGQEYTPKRVLVEGWLHKKGTGHDWLSSRVLVLGASCFGESSRI